MKFSYESFMKVSQSFINFHKVSTFKNFHKKVENLKALEENIFFLYWKPDVIKFSYSTSGCKRQSHIHTPLGGGGCISVSLKYNFTTIKKNFLWLQQKYELPRKFGL